MVETPDGKLYGTGVNSNYGGIMEYDYPTNTITNSIFFNTGLVPIAPLMLATDGKLYGTTFDGGTTNGGILFSYTPGSDSTITLVNLDSNANPYSALIQAADGNLYGMTMDDGPYSSGTIYRYNISTGTYTVLYNLPQGAAPEGPLLEIGADTLLGVTNSSLPNYRPVIFRYIISTGVFTALDSLPQASETKGGLMQATDGKFYGLASNGGLYSKGFLFRYDMSAGIIDTLHNFGSGTDGRIPEGELYQASDGMLYGITSQGGTDGQGTIFRYNIAASTYTLTVNMISPILAAYYGHLIEYKVPPIRRHPASVSICAGQAVSFISVDTSLTATAEWQVSTDSGQTYTTIAGATDTLYSFTAVTSQSGNLYRAIFTYSGQSDTSMPATIVVWPVDTTYVSESICNGQSVTIGYSQYTTPGIHITTLYSATHGCDSIVELNLTIYPQAADTITAATCADVGYILSSYFYDQTGTYTDTLAGASVYGCDSLITLHLTVYPVSGDTITASICAGQSYTFGTNIYTSSGTYTDILPIQSINGCDSIQTLSLTVYPPATSSTIQAICPGSSYTLGTNTYTASGVYTDTLAGAAAYGCDSVITLYLLVLDSTTAYFSIQPSDTPHVWYIILPNAGNNITYTWTWGDSTSSIGDTVSHTYASAGYYNICVTVTDSAGCSANYCDTSVYLYKDQSGQMVYVEVLPQYPAGINTVNTENLNINYYRGAVHFSETLQAPTQLKLYDLSGRVVMEQNNFSGNVWNINSVIAQGVYVIQLQNGNYSLAKKLMILQ
jgi:uncharacterized repeat protein (TIGR03803 family)